MTPSEILKTVDASRPRQLAVVWVDERGNTNSLISDMSKADLCYLIKFLDTALTKQILADFGPVPLPATQEARPVSDIVKVLKGEKAGAWKPQPYVEPEGPFIPPEFK